MHQAREQDWYAVTPYGWAVLRYAEGTAVLKDKRFQQGNARWPAQNGVPDGPFARWWGETLLSLEGPDHLRLRKLLGPAFRSRTIEAMRPQLQALAHDPIDGYAERGRVEFVRERPELGVNAVEEVMRVNSTVTWVTREGPRTWTSTAWPSPGAESSRCSLTLPAPIRGPWAPNPASTSP